MVPFNLTFIKYAALALAIIAVVTIGYRTAYNHGELAAHQQCIEETEHLVKQIHERITAVEHTLDNIADIATRQQEEMARDIDKILKYIKTKPVVTIKNGKCVPSSHFVDGLNQAIRRANQK